MSAVPPPDPAVPPVLPPDPLPVAERPFTAIESRRLGPVRRWFAEHPRGTDVVVALWFLVPSLIGLAFPIRLPGVHWTLVAMTAAALLLRRRQPEAVLAWTVAAAALSLLLVRDTGGHEFAVALAVYAVASLRPPRRAWLLTGLSVVVMAGLVLLSLDTLVATASAASEQEIEPRGAIFAGLASWTTASILTAHAIGTSVRSRRLHTQDLVDRANRIALERDQRAQLAAAAERTRIAREMHDVVAHSVSVMVALADGASASLDRRPDDSRLALRELSATGRDALAEMRGILGVLRSDETPDALAFDGPAPLAPTRPDLDELLARFRAAGLPVERVDRGAPLPPVRGLAMTIYRVVQESLTNVLRHAPGTGGVRVEIDRRADVVVVDVRNEAGARPAQPGSGRGLLGVRERVAAAGGTVSAGPDGSGWRVHARLPLPPEQVDEEEER